MIQNDNFEIDKLFLRKDFYLEENKDKRNWYFSTFSKQKNEEIRTEWYEEMNRLKITIPFFIWFETYASRNNIEIPFKNSNINVQTSQLRKWDTTKHGIIQSIHPPLE